MKHFGYQLLLIQPVIFVNQKGKTERKYGKVVNIASVQCGYRR